MIVLTQADGDKSNRRVEALLSGSYSSRFLAKRAPPLPRGTAR